VLRLAAQRNVRHSCRTEKFDGTAAGAGEIRLTSLKTSQRYAGGHSGVFFHITRRFMFGGEPWNHSRGRPEIYKLNVTVGLLFGGMYTVKIEP